MGVEFQSSSGAGQGCIVHRVRKTSNEFLPPLLAGDRVVAIDGVLSFRNDTFLLLFNFEVPTDMQLGGLLFDSIIEELRRNQDRRYVLFLFCVHIVFEWRIFFGSVSFSLIQYILKNAKKTQL